MSVLLIPVLTAVLGGSVPVRAAPALFRVYTDFQSKPAEAVKNAMQRETESIISPTGWQIVWDPLSTASQDGSLILAVVRFKGVCDTAGVSVDETSARRPRVLGITYIQDGIILPYSDIGCSAIQNFLASPLASLSAPERELVFGRALGRVLAHELYHVLTKKLHHGFKGAAQGQFTSQQLLAEEFRFGRREVQDLRASLVQVLTTSGPPAIRTAKKVASLFIGRGCAGCHGSLGEGTRWGPPLQVTCKEYDAKKLANRLASPSSIMYGRAKRWNLLWSEVTPRQVQQLLNYLQRLGNSGEIVDQVVAESTAGERSPAARAREEAQAKNQRRR